GDDGDGEQAYEVEREAGRVDGPEGRDDGQRKGDGGDHGGAPVAQEDEHHGNGEDGTLDQRGHGRVVGAERVVDHRVDQLELDVGVRLAQLLDLPGDVGSHHHVAGALPARDGEGDDRRAVERGEGALLGRGVLHRTELVEPHFAPLRQGDGRGGEILDRLLAGERADGLLAPGDLAAAAGQVDVGGPQLPVDVAGGDAEGEQAVGVERHADLALGAAHALDLGDALDALQRAHHH